MFWDENAVDELLVRRGVGVLRLCGRGLLGLLGGDLLDLRGSFLRGGRRTRSRRKCDRICTRARTIVCTVTRATAIGIGAVAVTRAGASSAVITARVIASTARVTVFIMASVDVGARDRVSEIRIGELHGIVFENLGRHELVTVAANNHDGVTAGRALAEIFETVINEIRLTAPTHRFMSGVTAVRSIHSDLAG